MDVSLVVYRNVGTNNGDLPAQVWLVRPRRPDAAEELDPGRRDAARGRAREPLRAHRPDRVLGHRAAQAAGQALRLPRRHHARLHRRHDPGAAPRLRRGPPPRRRHEGPARPRRRGALRLRGGRPRDARAAARPAPPHRRTPPDGIIDEPGTAGQPALRRGLHRALRGRGRGRAEPLGGHAAGAVRRRGRASIAIERNRAVRRRAAGARPPPSRRAGSPPSRPTATSPSWASACWPSFGVEPCGEILLDEKLGLHIAFGRSDHFGGQVGAAQFSQPEAVVHIDRIYLPGLQPRVVPQRVDLVDADGRAHGADARRRLRERHRLSRAPGRSGPFASRYAPAAPCGRPGSARAGRTRERRSRTEHDGRAAGRGAAAGERPGTWPRTGLFASFAHRDFRLFWAGSLISNVGSWMQMYALSIVVFSFRRSSFDLGLVGFLGGIPTLLHRPAGRRHRRPRGPPPAADPDPGRAAGGGGRARAALQHGPPRPARPDRLAGVGVRARPRRRHLHGVAGPRLPVAHARPGAAAPAHERHRAQLRAVPVLAPARAAAGGRAGPGRRRHGRGLLRELGQLRVRDRRAVGDAARTAGHVPDAAEEATPTRARARGAGSPPACATRAATAPSACSSSPPRSPCCSASPTWCCCPPSSARRWGSPVKQLSRPVAFVMAANGLGAVVGALVVASLPAGLRRDRVIPSALAAAGRAARRLRAVALALDDAPVLGAGRRGAAGGHVAHQHLDAGGGAARAARPHHGPLRDGLHGHDAHGEHPLRRGGAGGRPANAVWIFALPLLAWALLLIARPALLRPCARPGAGAPSGAMSPESTSVT